VSTLVRDGKGILDSLDLAVVIENFESVVELGVTLDKDEVREDVRIEPVSELVVTREAGSDELLKLVL
jgi:hypothetical protein